MKSTQKTEILTHALIIVINIDVTGEHHAIVSI